MTIIAVVSALALSSVNVKIGRLLDRYTVPGLEKYVLVTCSVVVWWSVNEPDSPAIALLFTLR